MNTTTTHPVSTNQGSVSDASVAGARRWFTDNGLERQRNRRLLGGVSAGFAKRYGVNLLVSRLLGLMSVLVLSPVPYVVLWVLMPRES